MPNERLQLTGPALSVSSKRRLPRRPAQQLNRGLDGAGRCVMRTIAGALLIVAASICFAASLIVQGLATRGYEFDGAGFVGALFLGIFGMILLWVGLNKDQQK